MDITDLGDIGKLLVEMEGLLREIRDVLVELRDDQHRWD